MARKIPLTRGECAIVDDEDYDYLMQFSWQYDPKGYAQRGRLISEQRRKGRKGTILMHRQIMGFDKPRPGVDHINGNGLDNRKVNLRPANQSLNNANRKVLSTNKSGYRGVSFHTRRGKWQANLSGRYLGLFDDPKEAYEVYKRAKLKLWKGEYVEV